LNEPANVEAVGESTREAGQEEVRYPVRNDRDAAQRGRVKAVEHHLVGNDVLDVVGHHGGGSARDIDAKIAIGERRKGLMRRRGRGRAGGRGICIQWGPDRNCVVPQL
jgi:hypothetical protein